MKTNKGLAPIAIVLIIIAALAVGGVVYYNKNKTEKNLNNDTVDHINIEQISFEDIDTLPLFPRVEWNYQEERSIFFDLKGYGANSKTIQVGETEWMPLVNDFTKFYEDRLPDYVIDNQLLADGVRSSSWGYKRDKYYVVLGYHAEPIIPKEEVGGGPCPCNLEFSVFTGKKQ
jgi:hypothetical protein